MADPIIPTPQDTQLLIQDTATRAASANTAAYDMGAGFAAGGLGEALAAVILVSAVKTSDGNESYSFVLQESADNISFFAAGAPVLATAAGTTAAKGRVKNRYVRLALTAGGTNPSVTFKAWINPLP